MEYSAKLIKNFNFYPLGLKYVQQRAGMKTQKNPIKA